MAPPKPPLPNESAHAYHRRITSAGGVPENTEEVMLMAPPPKKERHFSETTKLVVSVGKSVTVAAAIFAAGWVANERVGKVLVEQIAIKEEQAAQRALLVEAVTKEYFSWKFQQATDACFTRAWTKLGAAKVPVRCPNFPTRGMPTICHFLLSTDTP